MLHGLIDCRDSLIHLSSQLSENDVENSLLKEGETISSIVETKLQSILLQLTKVYKTIQLKKRSVHCRLFDTFLFGQV